MTEPSDFHVTIKIRNNHLFSRRRAQGFSQKDMAAAIGISLDMYVRLEACSAKPINKGKWTKYALAISDYFEVDPEVMWPEIIQKVDKNKIEVEMAGEELLRLASPADPSEALQIKLLASSIAEVLSTLSAKEQMVIKGRFYDDRTLEEIGSDTGVDRERIRQIEAKALRKLRHSTRASKLKEAAWGSDPVDPVEL